MPPIYLDYNATTPVDPAVLDAMLPYLQGEFGNPSSSHAYGVHAHAAVEAARASLAALLGCSADELVFTGGASEANNLAIKGIAEAHRDRGNHIITSQIEHPAVLATCRYLERRGYQVTYVTVDSQGSVNPNDVARAITSRTILITIMHANNEAGTIQPIAAIGRIAREHGVVFHTDAAQSVGKIPVQVDELGVDLLTVAGHKYYAPKGIGALYIRRGVHLESLIHGAGHEGSRHAGTENVPYIVGLGEASRIAAHSLREAGERLHTLTERLRQGLVTRLDGVFLNGHPTERLPNTLNVSFSGLDSSALLAALPEIAASTGSACHSGRTEPSSVLVAMGVSIDLALGAVRFSLGRWTTEAEVDRAAQTIADQMGVLRRTV